MGKGVVGAELSMTRHTDTAVLLILIQKQREWSEGMDVCVSTSQRKQPGKEGYETTYTIQHNPNMYVPTV